MKKESQLFSKDTKTIILSIFLLTLLFAFNDKKEEFVFSSWVSNFFFTAIIASSILLFNFIGAVLTARWFGEKIHPKIFGSSRFPRKEADEEDESGNTFSKTAEGYLCLFFLTPIFPILLLLLSNGAVILPLVYTFEKKITKKVGCAYSYLEERHLSAIAMVSMMGNLLLLSIFKILNFPAGVWMSSWFIFWNLLPTPNLIGSKMLAGSRLGYIFFFLFSILFILLINVISLWAVLPALVIALMLALWYFIRKEMPR
jgi:hypothetical protein